MAATERVPVLMTPTEKKQTTSKAKRMGLTVGEFMRRAAHEYVPHEDEAALSAMIDQMNISTERAEKAIDDTLLFIRQSNERMDTPHKRLAK